MEDAEGFDWLYTYDGNGNILDIEDALHGHYVMAYGPRNERTFEQNQDTNRWRYAYDELLRLQRQTDPNGTTREPTYDAAGRVLFVQFSTGRRDSFAYDPNDNPQAISRRSGGVTTATRFVYDALDRPIEQTDALAQTVLYGYDPLGRVTTLTYPGGKTLTNRYDALGRLTSQTDWAARQTTYAYDQADRLIRRAYPNGVVQTNTFDTAGRITSLSHSTLNPQPSTINLALTYAYDRNGNKTGGSEKGTFGWPQPSLTDETARYTAGGKLIDRQVQEQSVISNRSSVISYAYDLSGNMTNAAKMLGTTNAESWSLTYDEDNRTTAICWKLGALCDKLILNRYDALGRRISKTVDGVTTGYVLSLVGGMERILCDLDHNGTVTAWYVHGPDLCYRVDATNNLVCYHADPMANIISLTGPTGTNLAQYAYTPYGRTLGSTNLQSQIVNPYLFVGSQGVMEELPSLYFMRARYYSAEAGVFLSTDPVKKIGPGWRPEVYSYANGNPLRFLDPDGNMTRERAAMIQQYQQESLQDELDAIYWNARADVLQGVYDSLKTLESLVTGDVVGVATGLAKQTSTLLGVLGENEYAEAVSGAAGIVDLGKGLYDIGKIANNADKLAAHYNKIDGNWSKIMGYSSKGPVGGMYADVLSPIAKTPFGVAEYFIQNPLQPSNVGKPTSGGTVSAANYAQSLNTVQKTSPCGNSTGNGTTTQSVSNGGGSSGGGNAFGKVITTITQSKTYQTVSTAVKQATTSVAQAVSSAVKSVVSIFSSWFK